MGNTRNYATWITPGVLEYFPLLTWNKNAQAEQEGTRLPCSQSSQSCSGSQYQPWPSPYRPPPASSPHPPPRQHPGARSLRASFAKRGSRRRSLDARVTEPVFVLFKKQIPIRAQPPHSRGDRGKWQQGAGVQSENKRMTEYNLPCQLTPEGRKGKRRR